MSEAKAEQTIGVTLSGGGFRATIFSLGVLYYLVDRDLGKNIRYVASVSGGSVANAFVAQECDLSSITADRFRAVTKQIARKVARGSLFQSPPVVAWIGISALVLLATMALTIMAKDKGLRVFGLLLTVFLSAAALQMRGAVLSWALGWEFFRHGRRFTKLRDLSKRGVRHVIIATELGSGRPVFVECDWLHGPGVEDGYGKSSHLSLHRVVRWSCSVPALLPPGLVRTKTLSIENAIQGEPLNLPDWLFFVDGGVCNNLGTDYHGLMSPFSFGTRTDFYKPPAADLEITVDSSGSLEKANSRLARLPFFGEFFTLARNVSILYQNTIIPRRETGIPIISIAFPPMYQFAVAGPIAAEGSDRHERSRRVHKLQEYFRAHFETHHEQEGIVRDLDASARRIPTTFKGLGKEATARLLLHGYLSALAVCYSDLNIEPPKDICHRGIYHFRQIVSEASELICDPLGWPNHRCNPLDRIRDARD